MKRFLPLLLCLLLSFFTAARATKPAHTSAADAKTSQRPMGKDADAENLPNDSFNMSDAGQQEVATDQDTDEEGGSDNEDSMEDAADDESEDMGDEDTADDDGADVDGGS